MSLKGLGTPSGAISFSALRKVLDALHDGSERALRLAIEGESVRAGPIPAWITKSADFVLTGMKKGSTQLVFEAPTIGDVAPRQIQQQDLWYTVPEPGDTALTILAKSIADVRSEKLDSERYDGGVLESLLKFRQIIDDDKVKVRLTARGRPGERFTLDKMSFQAIEEIRRKTPDPQAVVLTGFLDEIGHSQRKFQLILENSQVVRGKIREQAIPLEQVRALWGKKVTVKGTLHFLPTKKPRFLDANIIQMREAGDEAFSSLTLPLSTQEVVSKIYSGKIKEGIVSDIWGKWPGQETTEQILEALRETKSND